MGIANKKHVHSDRANKWTSMGRSDSGSGPSGNRKRCGRMFIIMNSAPFAREDVIRTTSAALGWHSSHTSDFHTVA